MVTKIGMNWGPTAMWWSGLAIWNNSPTTFNSTARRVAYCFQAPKDGTIDTARFYLTGKVGSPTMRVWFESLASTGNPNGLLAGTAIESQSIAAAGYVTFTFASPAVVSRGDFLALVFDCSNGAAGTYYTCNRAGSAGGTEYENFPNTRYSTDSGVTWLTGNGFPAAVALRYSDGATILAPRGEGPTGPSTAAAYNSTTSPDEKGARFQVPYPFMVHGAVFCGRWGANASASLYLYDSASVVISQGSLGFNTSAVNVSQTVMFERTALVPDTDYYLGVRSLNNVDLRLFEMQHEDADYRSAYPFCDGLRWVSVERTSLGAWTVNTLKMPFMHLLVSGLNT